MRNLALGNQVHVMPEKEMPSSLILAHSQGRVGYMGTKTDAVFSRRTLFKKIILNSCSTGDKRSVLYFTVYCFKSLGFLLIS